LRRSPNNNPGEGAPEFVRSAGKAGSPAVGGPPKTAAFAERVPVVPSLVLLRPLSHGAWASALPGDGRARPAGGAFCPTRCAWAPNGQPPLPSTCDPPQRGTPPRIRHIRPPLGTKRPAVPRMSDERADLYTLGASMLYELANGAFALLHRPRLGGAGSGHRSPALRGPGQANCVATCPKASTAVPSRHAARPRPRRTGNQSIRRRSRDLAFTCPGLSWPPQRDVRPSFPPGRLRRVRRAWRSLGRL